MVKELVPDFRLFNLRESFNRMNPLFWIFVAAVICIILGLSFGALSKLLWIGLGVVAFYLIIGAITLVLFWKSIM